MSWFQVDILKAVISNVDCACQVSFDRGHRYVCNRIFTFANADGHLYGQGSNRSVIMFLMKPFVNGTMTVSYSPDTPSGQPHHCHFFTLCLKTADYIWPVFVLTRHFGASSIPSYVYMFRLNCRRHALRELHRRVRFWP